MDRNAKSHSPLPTTGSITDPEADAANRHLSWSADDPHTHEDEDSESGDEQSEDGESVFMQYVGMPDGTFEVTVTIHRGQVAAVHTESGVGEFASNIEDAKRLAYERADRALRVLEGEDHS